jgi:aminoglycoside phosphotransferase (APT) family kinase protein
VPYVHILETADSPFGKPFLIMDRVDGQLLRGRMSSLPEAERAQLRTAFCRLFVQLHQLDWRPFQNEATGHEVTGPYFFVDKYLAGEREVVEEWGMAGFLPVLAWLEERRDEAPCFKPAVIHGDFHAGNVLIRGDASLIVIDWTGCHVSDARFDVARTLLVVRAYGSEEARKLYLAEYERLAGEKLQHFDWFAALACSLRLRDVAIALSKGPEKLGWRSDVGTTVMEHMAAHRQTYDFLLELTGVHVPEVEALLAIRR